MAESFADRCGGAQISYSSAAEVRARSAGRRSLIAVSAGPQQHRQGRCSTSSRPEVGARWLAVTAAAARSSPPFSSAPTTPPGRRVRSTFHWRCAERNETTGPRFFSARWRGTGRRVARSRRGEHHVAAQLPDSCERRVPMRVCEARALRASHVLRSSVAEHFVLLIAFYCGPSCCLILVRLVPARARQRRRERASWREGDRQIDRQTDRQT